MDYEYRFTPPCDTCGQGESATAHGAVVKGRRRPGMHNYTYTFDPEAKWVPESEAEAERLKRLEEKG